MLNKDHRAGGAAVEPTCFTFFALANQPVRSRLHLPWKSAIVVDILLRTIANAINDRGVVDNCFLLCHSNPVRKFFFSSGKRIAGFGRQFLSESKRSAGVGRGSF